MNQRKLFLQWVLTVSLITVGAVIAASLGWFGKIYSLDATKLSVVITVLFLAASAWCGKLAWRVDEALTLITAERTQQLTLLGATDDGASMFFTGYGALSLQPLQWQSYGGIEQVARGSVSAPTLVDLQALEVDVWERDDPWSDLTNGFDVVGPDRKDLLVGRR